MLLNVSKEHLTYGLLIGLTQRLKFSRYVWRVQISSPAFSAEMSRTKLWTHKIQQLAQMWGTIFIFKAWHQLWKFGLETPNKRWSDSKKWLILLPGDLLKHIRGRTWKGNLEWRLFPQKEIVPPMLQIPGKFFQWLSITDCLNICLLSYVKGPIWLGYRICFDQREVSRSHFGPESLREIWAALPPCYQDSLWMLLSWCWGLQGRRPFH